MKESLVWVAAEVGDKVDPSIQIWVVIIGGFFGLMTLILPPLIKHKMGNKPGINIEVLPDEPATGEPKPPVFKESGELDEIASFLDMHDSVRRLYRERAKDAEIINTQTRDLAILNLKFENLQRQFTTGTRQIIAWATHLKGEPPHEIPEWVKEIVQSAQSESQRVWK